MEFTETKDVGYWANKVLYECGDDLLDISSLPNEGERVKYVYNLMKARGLMPFAGSESPRSQTKNLHISIGHRAAGDALYSNRQYDKAVRFYSTAVAYAPLNSSALALAYAKRSAVILALGKPDQALRDISRAMTIGCEKSVLKDLIQRRKLCHNYKPPPSEDRYVDREWSTVFEPPTVKHPDIPCASAKLEVSYDAECGRKITATEDIDPGELVAFEKPYTSYLLEEHFFTRCYYCCEEVYALIACHTCNKVMFCSEECFMSAYREFHKYECLIMSFYSCKEYIHIAITLRIALKARYQLHTWRGLIEALKSLQIEQDPTKRGYTAVDGKYMYDSSNYWSVHALETNDKKWDNLYIFPKAFRCVVLLNYLITHTKIFAEKPWQHLMNDNKFWIVAGLFLRHTLTVCTNAKPIFGNSLCENNRQHTVGFAMYPFLSLVNHSCGPNSVVINIGKTGALFTTRTIKKGEELFLSYGPNYVVMNITRRRSHLYINSSFICHCVACTNDWPTFPKLKSVASEIGGKLATIDQIVEECQIFFRSHKYGPKRRVRHVMEKVYEQLSTLERLIPCQEIIQYEEYLFGWWNKIAKHIKEP